MTGPAWTVSAAQSRRRPATGAISITLTDGTWRPSVSHRERTPARVVASSAAIPDSISRATKAQVDQAMASAPPGPPDWRRPLRSANLATKPESGGSPARSTAHDRKLRPSIAVVAGSGIQTTTARERVVTGKRGVDQGDLGG